MARAEGGPCLPVEACIRPECRQRPAKQEASSFMARSLTEADIRTHPERLQVLNGGLYDRLKALIGEVTVDLDKPLSPDDE